MKVLLSAYACHPVRGSEPGVGWGWLEELGKSNELWVLFYSGQGQAEAVQKAVDQLPYRRNIHLLPIGVPRILRDRFYRLRYEFWQYRAYEAAKHLVKEVQIDFVHHVTIAAWWNCGHLWKLKVPFIFGPISGIQKVPKAAYPFLRWRDRVYELTRVFLINLAWKLWSRPRRAMERARLVLTANYETAERVKGIRKSDPVITLSEVGVHSVGEKNAEGGKLRATDSLKLLWSGQLIPRKNFGLLMEALSRLPDEIRWHLRVAGEGNLLEYWKTKSVEHGLREHLTFLGQVAYSQMSEQYRWADVFAFPSLREATGTVILEAMSYGLPVIALKLHGARVVLDDSCGILVPVVSKEQMVKDFRDAIIKLYYDPELRRKLGEAGRKRVEESHLWEKKAQRMSEIYRQVLTQGN